MIRYNKLVQVRQQKTGQWQITTDRGDQYELTNITGNESMTSWWQMQYTSILREWQKDAVLQELTRMGYHEDYQLFVVHKRGQGFSQAHDIVIFYHHRHKIWVLSTSQHLWFVPSSFSDCNFTTDAALAVDITQLQDRNAVYTIIDQLNAMSYDL